MIKSNLPKKKILIVGSFPKNLSNKKIYGGQLTACKKLKESIFFKKYKVSTLDSTSINNPPPNAFIRAFFSIKRFIVFFNTLNFKRPEVVILFLADGLSAIEKGVMVIIAKFCQLKVMIFPRAGKLIKQYESNLIIRKLINLLFKKADIFLCQGKTFQTFATKYLGFTNDFSPIVPNWTASDEYLKIGSYRNYRKNFKCPRIIFIGWVEDFKGIFELIEAAKMLKEKQYSFHITIAGNGNALKKAYELTQIYNLTQNITFTGWVSLETKIELLKIHNIFVLPSWNEGLPNAMIEAMSAGLACIVSDVGMIPDYIQNEYNGLIFENKKVKELYRALIKLVGNEEFTRKIAMNGFQYAKSNFSIENGIGILSEQVERITKNSGK